MTAGESEAEPPIPKLAKKKRKKETQKRKATESKGNARKKRKVNVNLENTKTTTTNPKRKRLPQRRRELSSRIRKKNEELKKTQEPIQTTIQATIPNKQKKKAKKKQKEKQKQKNQQSASKANQSKKRKSNKARRSCRQEKGNATEADWVNDCLLIVEEFLKQDFFSLFHNPVDKEQWDDYYEVIPCPMDMTCCKKKLVEKQYERLDDFIVDFELIWINCRMYNPHTEKQNSNIIAITEKLEKNFRNEMDKVMKDYGTKRQKKKWQIMKNKPGGFLTDAEDEVLGELPSEDQ